MRAIGHNQSNDFHGNVLEGTVKMTHAVKMKSMLSSDTLVSDVEEA